MSIELLLIVAFAFIVGYAACLANQYASRNSEDDDGYLG